MHAVHEIADGVFWVGVNDRRIERFENMFPLSDGVAYNAYLIKDEKTALLDTVESSVRDRFLQQVENVLDGRALDYLVIHHMEPDHCGNIEEIVRRYPEVKVVGNRKTFEFFKHYYRADLSANAQVVKEGDILSLGTRSLRFYLAPMVHWPEVMFSMDLSDGMLYSADAFGSFGALPGTLFADELDFNRYFLGETRRYHANIVGRYGNQIQAVLKRLPVDSISMICPLHGPIWRKDLSVIWDKIDTWSAYRPERTGVVFIYASMYGNTAEVAETLAFKLGDRGVGDIRLHDVSKTHPSHIIADLWEYSHMVVASPTYNMQLYPPMDALLRELAMLNLQDRDVVIIGNHTWSSAAVRQMIGLFGTMKDIRFLGEPLDIHSSLKAEEEPTLDSLADVIFESVLNRS
ncbi:MAG: FprA family A-type flavoprotein [Sphaerochaetaceae bacterium]